MRRILLVSDVFPPKHGGSGRWFWETYCRLPRDKVVIAAGEDARQSDFDHKHDLRVFRVPLAMTQWGLRSIAGLTGYARGFRKVRRLVRAEEIGVVHAARNLPEGFLAWMIRKWTGIPYACYVHGEDVRTTGLSRELRWMTQRVFNCAEFIIANSHNTASILKTDWNLREGKVYVLYPGVDTQRFFPAPLCAQTRKQLGWTGRTVVATVGRLQMRKGQDHMIRALLTIRKVIPDLLYCVIGDGKERASLMQLTRELGLTDHVQFAGELDDSHLVVAYQQCDLFALPNRTIRSDIEGFGMVLLEAQACGKAVLAGSSGGTSEALQDRVTGRIVDCESPELLAEAVIELLSDRERLARMGLEGRRWVVDRFDWQALSNQVHAIFDQGSVQGQS
jgi:phosphatidylinositol alpha-1,6-mannosyltransferase